MVSSLCEALDVSDNMLVLLATGTETAAQKKVQINNLLLKSICNSDSFPLSLQP